MGHAQSVRLSTILKNHPLKKPDADNVAKIILDALNGIAYLDDKQVVDLGVHKSYNATPGVLVFVYEI